MKRIGILSDTHACLDPRVARYFADVDEIWHAGDIGSAGLLRRLQAIRPTRAVYGNIDGQDLRQTLSPILRFRCEQASVLLTHIGGYPGHYAPQVSRMLHADPPDIFVCGHSHILRVMPDPTLNLLHINPGAAGTYGQQTVQTLVRLTVEGSRATDLEVIELSRKTLTGSQMTN